MGFIEMVLPFGVMIAGVSAMGAAQYHLHKLFHGQPRKIMQDKFDELLGDRDADVVADAGEERIAAIVNRTQRIERFNASGAASAASAHHH